MIQDLRTQQQNRANKLAWLYFSILSLPYLMVYFHRVAPAVVADLLMAEFQLSGAVLGNLAAIYFYVYTVMQLPAGVFADAYGARRTVFLGMVLSGLGSILFAQASGLGLASLGRILIGFGVSVIFVSILKIVTKWFPNKKFGTMSGLTLLIGNSGALVAATPLAYMVSLWSWRFSFILVGVICFFAGILTLVIVRDRPGLLGLPSPNGGEMENQGPGILEVLKGLVLVMKNPYSWPPFITFFGIYGSLMAFQGVWGIPFLVQQYDMSRFDASSKLLIMALGLMVGCPLAGAISDHLKKRKLPLAVFTSLYLCCWIIMLFWPGGKPSMTVLSFLFFAMGLFASGFIIVWACAKEVNPPGLSGCAMGLANMGGFLGAAVMQPVFGWALDHQWDGTVDQGIRVYHLGAFRFAFFIMTAVLFVTSLSMIFLRETHAGMQSDDSN